MRHALPQSSKHSGIRESSFFPAAGTKEEQYPCSLKKRAAIYILFCKCGTLFSWHYEKQKSRIFAAFRFEWGKVDSNHRRRCQQIYSLSPLATREFPQILVFLANRYIIAQCRLFVNRVLQILYGKIHFPAYTASCRSVSVPGAWRSLPGLFHRQLHGRFPVYM